MDYKELIERLHHLMCPWGYYDCERIRQEGFCDCEQCRNDAAYEIANEIKTLLAEREAMLAELRGLCWCCAHGKKKENGLTSCEHMRKLGIVFCGGGKFECLHWEWCGPADNASEQKERKRT